MKDSVCTIIVTYNRKDLLVRCVEAVQMQTALPQHILVVDNCSTDGTPDIVSTIQKKDPSVHYIRLVENTGGAGGFYAGMQAAMKSCAGLLWLMDDDAEPEPEALEQLLINRSESCQILGSAAYYSKDGKKRLCWPVANIMKDKHQLEDRLNVLPPVTKVSSLPFLGFLLPVTLIAELGLPEKAYFVSGDDAEYCSRARNLGIPIYLVSTSRLKHPEPMHISISIGKRMIRILKLPPWRRYYDTRNRILTARRHYGYKLWTQTLPGTVLRWVVTLFLQDGRSRQSKAFFLGIIDGFSGKGGIRWQLKKKKNVRWQR